MKLEKCQAESAKVEMPPTRGHDLKLVLRVDLANLTPDAPHTGARLETLKARRGKRGKPDAPHTGARLETFLGYGL